MPQKPPHGELIRAASQGDLKRVVELIDQGADLEEKDGAGDTPLNEAARTNRAEIVTLLIDKGANMNVFNRSGKNALGWARHYNHNEIIRLLSEAADNEHLREEWAVIGMQKIAHIGVYPKAQKKLTDVFDLATRERYMISDDTRSKSSCMTPITPFDKLPQSLIEKALDEFEKISGQKLDRDYVLNGIQIKKPGPQKPKP